MVHSTRHTVSSCSNCPPSYTEGRFLPRVLHRHLRFLHALVQGTPTHNRKVPLLAASPGLGVILVPGRKKRKRKIGSYQPGHGFNDDHDDSTFDPDLPAGKRVRLSMGDAKPDPAPAESVHIRGLAFLKKAAYNDIGRGAPNTGPEFSEKGSKVKRLRKRGENQAAAATKLKRFYLPPCEEPEKDDATITPTYIDNILRTVASDGDAVETRVDLDMSGDPAPRSRTPTTVQHGPPPPPLAREESVASQGLSQRTESTQEVIDVLDFELNLFGNEEEDADLQRALQQDFDMYSSPIRRTVCTPSAIELDNCIGLPRGYPSNLPYGGVPGVGGSWECNDLVPYADEAVSFTGEYLYGPSKRVSNKSEENIPDPFAPHVIDLYRQTIQEQLRVWAENPGADVSLDLADELVATKEKLAMRVAERKLAEDAAGVSRPHEKGDIESFIELDLRPVPSLPEGTLGEGGIIPESPKAEQRSMPEERVVKQAAGMSPSGLTGSGSSRRSTTPGRFAIVDSDMKASDESVGTSQNTALWAESQEVVQSSAPKGVYVSTTGPTGSESAHQEPTPPSKCTGSTLRAHRSRSSQKVTELTIEDLERIMLKRLNLTPEVLAPRKRPVWEVRVPSTRAY